MKQILKITLIVISTLCLCSSCNRKHDLKDTLGKFMSNVIIIPDSLSVILDGNLVAHSSLDMYKDKKLIMFVDSSLCTSCRISALNNMIELYELSETDGRFSVIAIFSPAINESQYIEEMLKHLYFPYPLYIDRNHLFLQINSIPKDSRFHNFLIDKEGRILCVGNPLGNSKLKSVFMAALNNNN